MTLLYKKSEYRVGDLTILNYYWDPKEYQIILYCEVPRKDIEYLQKKIKGKGVVDFLDNLIIKSIDPKAISILSEIKREFQLKKILE